MPALLAWTALGITGVCGLSTIVVLGLLPRWTANAADGDLTGLGLLDGETV